MFVPILAFLGFTKEIKIYSKTALWNNGNSNNIYHNLGWYSTLYIWYHFVFYWVVILTSNHNKRPRHAAWFFVGSFYLTQANKSCLTVGCFQTELSEVGRRPRKTIEYCFSTGDNENKKLWSRASAGAQSDYVFGSKPDGRESLVRAQRENQKREIRNYFQSVMVSKFLFVFGINFIKCVLPYDTANFLDIIKESRNCGMMILHHKVRGPKQRSFRSLRHIDTVIILCAPPNNDETKLSTACSSSAYVRKRQNVNWQ